jgi:hypothetical protein
LLLLLAHVVKQSPMLLLHALKQSLMLLLHALKQSLMLQLHALPQPQLPMLLHHAVPLLSDVAAMLHCNFIYLFVIERGFVRY